MTDTSCMMTMKSPDQDNVSTVFFVCQDSFTEKSLKACIISKQACNQKLLLGGPFGQNVNLFGKIVDLFTKVWTFSTKYGIF